MPVAPAPETDAATEADTGLHLGHRAMYYVFRPLLKRLPLRMYLALAMVAAIPVGTLQALRRGGFYGRVLKCCDRRDTLAGRIRLAIRCVYIKARHIEPYVYEVTHSLQATWDGPPETEPCLYFLINTFGSEAIAKWMDLYPAVIFRREYGGEGELNIATATPGQMWRAHQAKVRAHASGHRHAIVGSNPMAYRKLLTGKQSIILYQDLWDEQTHDGPPFLGTPATLTAGSLRLAKLAGGLPMRFMTVQPKGVHWCVHVTERVEATYETIARLVEADIKRRPGEWLLWNEWFGWVDGRN